VSRKDQTTTTLSDTELTTVFSTKLNEEIPKTPAEAAVTTTTPIPITTSQHKVVTTVSDAGITTDTVKTGQAQLQPAKTEPSSYYSKENMAPVTPSDVVMSTETITVEPPTTTAATTVSRINAAKDGTTDGTLGDLELIYSAATEMPDIPTTAAAASTSTGHRSRDLTEGSTVSRVSEVELTTNLITTEKLDLTTTTTTTTTILPANDPILRGSRQSKILSTASGLELTNSTPEFSLSDTVPVTDSDTVPDTAPVTVSDTVPVTVPVSGVVSDTVPVTVLDAVPVPLDTPAAPEDANTTAEDTSKSAVSVARTPLSANDSTSIPLSHNNSRIPASTLRPRLSPKSRVHQCFIPGCFPSSPSSRDYYCCRRIGKRSFYVKGTCPAGKRFNAVFKSCDLRLSPVLPYLNQQYGRTRTNSVQDPVIRRIMNQLPTPVLINRPIPFLNENLKRFTV
jgi:hypothetical protein